MIWLFALLLVASLVVYGACTLAAFRHMRRPRALKVTEPGDYPGISLLKPIKGHEEALEENLESFFRQDYPGPLEIVFSSADRQDPGVAIARRVAQRHPKVSVRFTREAPEFGLNPKVRNLAGAMRKARHDLVLQSDANVRINTGYVRAVVDEFRVKSADLLGSMVIGSGEANAFAALENLQLNAVIAPAMCAADRIMKVTCVVGKAMLFRKSTLMEAAAMTSRYCPQRGATETGNLPYSGLEIVRDVLCEDFVLAQHFIACGKRVVFSAESVTNINARITARRFFSRHSRWLKMRAVIHIGSFGADLAANPVAWSLGFLSAVSLLQPHYQAAAALITALVVSGKLTCDALLSLKLRGKAPKLRHLLMVPFKDLAMVAVWGYASVSRTVSWRGTRLSFGRFSRLLDEGTSHSSAIEPSAYAMEHLQSK